MDRYYEHWGKRKSYYEIRYQYPEKEYGGGKVRFSNVLLAEEIFERTIKSGIRQGEICRGELFKCSLVGGKRRCSLVKRQGSCR